MAILQDNFIGKIIAKIKEALAGKQDILVSGTNLKTINNQSLLGEGNISLELGGKMNISGNINLATSTADDFKNIFDSMSDDEVRMYLVTNSSGTVTSSDEVVTVTYEDENSPAYLYFGKDHSFGVSVGDICSFIKRADSLVCKIISLSSAKAATDENPGADGLLSAEGKEKLDLFEYSKEENSLDCDAKISPIGVEVNNSSETLESKLQLTKSEFTGTEDLCLDITSTNTIPELPAPIVGRIAVSPGTIGSARYFSFDDEEYKEEVYSQLFMDNAISLGEGGVYSKITNEVGLESTSENQTSCVDINSDLNSSSLSIFAELKRYNTGEYSKNEFLVNTAHNGAGIRLWNHKENTSSGIQFSVDNLLVPEIQLVKDAQTEVLIDTTGITAPKFITKDGTSDQVVLGDGSLKSLSEIGGGNGEDSRYSQLLDLLSFSNYNIPDEGAVAGEYVWDDGSDNEEGVARLTFTPDGYSKMLMYNDEFGWVEETSAWTIPNIPVATTTSGGVMSPEDKTKLDSITVDSSGNTFELPVASSNNLGGVMIGDGLSITEGGVLSSNYSQFTKTLNDGEHYGAILTEQSFSGYWTASDPDDSYGSLQLNSPHYYYDGEKWVYESTGFCTSIDIPYATTTDGGIMSKEDKTNLDDLVESVTSLQKGAGSVQDSVVSDLNGLTISGNSVELSYRLNQRSSDGSYNLLEDEAVSIPLSTSTTAGLMSKEDKIYVDNLNKVLSVNSDNTGVIAPKFIKSNASAGQILMADGSVKNGYMTIKGTFNLAAASGTDFSDVFNDMIDGEMRMYLITDSNGLLPSKEETAVTVTYGLTYFGKSESFGASVGDILVFLRKSILFRVCRIIPLNDVKPSSGDFPGADGLSTVWDKNRINKIDGIEWTANHVRDTYLPKADRYPSRADWLINVDNCLENGVYPTCDTASLGLKNWSNQYTTVAVHRTSTEDNGGYHTIEQTAYGRGYDKGCIGKRIIFYKSDGTDTQYGPWNTITFGSSDSISSISLGQDATSSGFSSISLGQDAEATGHFSIALGYDAIATGSNSIALGSNAIASGESSTALGTGSEATADYSTALGTYNNPHLTENDDSATSLFTLGKGIADNNTVIRANALEIMKNNDIWFGEYNTGLKVYDGTTNTTPFIEKKASETSKVVLGDGTLKSLSEIGNYSVATPDSDGLMSKDVFNNLNDVYVYSMDDIFFTDNTDEVDKANWLYFDVESVYFDEELHRPIYTPGLTLSTFNPITGEIGRYNALVSPLGIPSATTTKAGLMSAADKVRLDFLYKTNRVSSVSNMPIDGRLIIATISSNDAFSFSSIPSEGSEIVVIIKNTSDSVITVVMPTESSYVNQSSAELRIPAGGVGEVNIISDGTNVYLRNSL